jgi:hypothetical protein
MTKLATRRQLDRTSIGYLDLRAAMMSNEALRQLAKRRGFEGAVARRELAKRDLEAGLLDRPVASVDVLG